MTSLATDRVVLSMTCHVLLGLTEPIKRCDAWNRFRQERASATQVPGFLGELCVSCANNGIPRKKCTGGRK